jgi:hypothetical protein
MVFCHAHATSFSGSMACCVLLARRLRVPGSRRIPTLKLKAAAVRAGMLEE